MEGRTSSSVEGRTSSVCATVISPDRSMKAVMFIGRMQASGFVHEPLTRLKQPVQFPMVRLLAPLARVAGNVKVIPTLALMPLTTSLRTKLAMLRDWGSWDADFIAVTASVPGNLIMIFQEIT